MFRKIIALTLAIALVCSNLGAVAFASVDNKINIEAGQYSFNTIEGETISLSQLEGKNVLLLFINGSSTSSAVGCRNSDNAITALSTADWCGRDDIEVIAVDINKNTKDHMEQYRKNIAGNTKNITFCYDQSRTAALTMWDMLKAVGYEQPSVYLPASFLIDSNGYIQYLLTGDNGEVIYRKYISRLVADIEPAPEVDVKIEGNFDYDEAYDVLAIVNSEREKEGLSPLKMDKDLLDAAMRRAAETAIYYSHTRPNGENCFTVLEDMSAVGENIAAGYTTAADVMNGWVDYPGHYANIVNSDFTGIGVGCFYQEDGSIHWVQLFGSDETVEPTASGVVTDTITIRVLEENLSLYVRPDSIVAERGDVEQLNLYHMGYGICHIDSSCVEFASDNTEIASVDQEGKVTAIATGDTNIVLKIKGGIDSNSFSVPVTVKQARADIGDMNIKLSTYSYVYDGTAKRPEVTIEGLTENVDFDVTYEDNINAGIAKVQITGKENYKGTITKNYMINKADLSQRKAELEYDAVKYDGQPKKPAVTIEDLLCDRDYYVQYSNNVEIGTAKVMVVGKGNYKGTITNLSFVITPAEEEKEEGGEKPGGDISDRVFGLTRYDTSIEAAKELKEILGIEKFDNIIVADGRNFADALAGAYLAKVKNAPILTVGDDMYSQVRIRDYIKADLKEGGKIYILGGTGAVEADFEGVLKADGYTVNRLEGATRFETNLAILKEAGVTDEDILVCSGFGYADSLSASAVGKPILLVDDNLRADQKEYLKTLKTANYYIIGGTGAVSERIEKTLKDGQFGNIERVAGANRFTTSTAVAKKFFPKESVDIVVLAYAMNFPDGLSGGPLAMSLGAPLILVTSDDTDAAKEYVKYCGAKKAVSLGGTALISKEAVDRIMSE